MFPGTIYDNIAMGAEKPTREEVIAASKAATCHSFISKLPEGYDTYLSGASIQLSGGQMQRLCIARAMVRNPSVLVLDESTSALDTTSERQVQDAIDNIRKTRAITIISVAHRLSTIVNSEKIAVISEGKIAEEGTHHELLALDGIYTTLCASQGITADSKFGRDIPAAPLGGSVTYSSFRDSKRVSVKSLVAKSMATGIAEEVNALEVVEEGGEILGEGGGGILGESTDTPEEEKLASKARLWELSRHEFWYIVMGGLGACSTFFVGCLLQYGMLSVTNLLVFQLFTQW